MLKTGFYVMYGIAILAFGAFMIEGLRQYSDLLIHLLLNGIGVGALLQALHALKTGEVVGEWGDVHREEHGLVFGLTVLVLFLASLAFSGFSLMALVY